MLKPIKKMFNDEKKAREFGRHVDEFLVDCIATSKTEEERAYFADQLKKSLADNEKYEEESSKCWYKIGYQEGMNVGVIIGGAAALLGFAIGNKIKR